MKKVSVIMGVYNTPIEYIDISINSILNQTYQNFEFIICNDGCTDNTFEYIKEKYGNNTKIKLIENKKNEGLAYTLNHCLEVVTGEYIARMDLDDESMLDRIEKQVKILEENKEIGLVSCNAYLFDNKENWGEIIHNEYIEKKDFLFNSPIIHPAILARKSAFDIVNNYRNIKMTYRMEDYDLFMRMFSKGIRMYTIQEKLYRFRENKESQKRRKFKYRINEMKVRVYGFKLLKLYPKAIIYVFKPIIVGLIPYGILKKLKSIFNRS